MDDDPSQLIFILPTHNISATDDDDDDGAYCCVWLSSADFFIVSNLSL
jgi:hypothetical protein